MSSFSCSPSWIMQQLQCDKIYKTFISYREHKSYMNGCRPIGQKSQLERKNTTPAEYLNHRFTILDIQISSILSQITPSRHDISIISEIQTSEIQNCSPMDSSNESLYQLLSLLDLQNSTLRTQISSIRIDIRLISENHPSKIQNCSPLDSSIAANKSQLEHSTLPSLDELTTSLELV